MNLLGFLGISIPLSFAIYYTCIESWTCAFSFFSVTEKYFGVSNFADMANFLSGFQGKEANQYFASFTPAFIFFGITVILNVYILSKGISKGIESFAKIALPMLFLFAIILVIRVWTLGTPDPGKPENNVLNGFAFLWNPNFSNIGSGKTWLAAAGQIFFTLSIGAGSILTYASYLKKRDDVVLTGLTTAITNEFAEVVLGASIAIPIAVAFLGIVETQIIAKGGASDLGFTAMPIIFQKLPLGPLLGMIWFMLLFFARITSSVALCSPAMAFLQEQVKISRQKSAILIGFLLLLGGLPVILLLKHGFLDEMDFWAGTFGLVTFALTEIILFAWIFGMKKGWALIHEGADIRIPRIFRVVIKYITRFYLITLLVFWGYQDGLPILMMKDMPDEHIPSRWGARALMLTLTVLVAIIAVKNLKSMPGIKTRKN